MKLYVLCSYGDGLNDPDVSTDYQELYEKMEKSYRMTLDHVSQTEEEQENTFLSRLIFGRLISSNRTLKTRNFLFPYWIGTYFLL